MQIDWEKLKALKAMVEAQDAHTKSAPAQFMFWVAGFALAIAYVVQPSLVLWASVFHPTLKIPNIDLAAMWTPVMGVLGVSGLGIASKFVTSREDRKNKELDAVRCAECPTKDCASCPLKIGLKAPQANGPGATVINIAAPQTPNSSAAPEVP